MATERGVAADGGETDPGDPDGDEESTDAWYGSSLGVGIVTADLLFLAGLVVVTSGQIHELYGAAESLDTGVVPWYVYVYSLLGALGYVFTALIDDLHCETVDVLEYNFRLPAALPLGAGVYLLSEVILAEAGGAGPVTVGLVFLTGLYVNLAYRRLGALARRLLPEGRTGSEDRATAGAGEAAPDRVDFEVSDGRGPEAGEPSPAE